ncbi:phage tail tape measure protein [Tissierella praeacuta]|uniref:phage tail tape measure protein n=1 Tax=Tissierella praeacuta TaxID=43131 RepID=UPI00334009DA
MAKQIATILSLKDKMSQPLVKVSKNVDKVTREMKKSQNQIEKWKNNSIKAMDKVIKKTAKIGAAAVGAFGALAIGTGFKGMMELDDASAKVKSIAGSSLELKNIQSELLKNSTATGIVVNELADAQYSATSSGVKANESMDAAVLSSKLAISGFTDTNSALKLMTSTMNVYGLTGTEAMQSVSDKMLVTQNLGVTSVGELASSLGSVTPIAKSVGVSLDEVLGAVGSLTKNGQSTSEAMTGLKGIMSNVIKPTKQAKDMAKKLGIDYSVGAIKSKGFAKWIEEVKEKTKGNTDAMGQLFGNVNALNAAISLTSEGGFADFNNILGEVIDSTGMTDEAFKTMTNTVGFKLNKLKNTSKNIFTSMMSTQSGLIGEYIDKMETWVTNNEEKIQGWVQSIGESVTKMVDFVKRVVDFVKEHEKAITTIMVFVGSIYAVIKVIGVLKIVLGGLHTVWLLLNGTLMITPLGWLVLAIGAVVAAGYLLWRNWETVMEWAGKLKDKLAQDWKETVESTKEAWNKIVETIKGYWEGLKKFLKNPIKGTVELFKKTKEDKNSTQTSSSRIPAFAKGTSYSPAGYARIHEKGGEIRKLSSGETIIPADKSERLLRGKGAKQDVKVEVKILGNVIGNRQFINEVGNEVYRKVSLAYQNV